MIHFLDGPAVGVELKLFRAPVMLRVVQGPSGKWDGLDRLGDQPRRDEKIFVYRRIRRPFIGFVEYRNKPNEKFVEAEYRFVIDQPADSDVRINEAWRRWCDAVRDGQVLAHWRADS